MIVTLTGATGFIGRKLVPALKEKGHIVRILARDPERAKVALDPDGAWAWDALAGPPPLDALAGADAVIHLAGESLADGRWTAKRKAALRASRIDATRNLVRALKDASPRPKTLISASAIGYYGDRPDGSLDENTAPGAGFLADLCREWEVAAQNAEPLGMRVVYLRTGVVIGKGGGALGKMTLPFKMGVGGKLGSGKQWMSWIHVDDEVGLILHALENESIRGPVNATAPSPATNAEFTAALGKALHRPAILPAPGFALKLALGEMADMLLTGQRVMPIQAEKTGYAFRYRKIADALAASV